MNLYIVEVILAVIFVYYTFNGSGGGLKRPLSFRIINLSYNEN